MGKGGGRGSGRRVRWADSAALGLISRWQSLVVSTPLLGLAGFTCSHCQNSPTRNIGGGGLRAKKIVGRMGPACHHQLNGLNWTWVSADLLAQQTFGRQIGLPKVRFNPVSRTC